MTSYGSFTLTETDSGTDLDSDSKPNGYIVQCRTFNIVQTRTQIPTPYFCTGQESESKSVPESVSDNVNEPFQKQNTFTHTHIQTAYSMDIQTGDINYLLQPACIKQQSKILDFLA